MTDLFEVLAGVGVFVSVVCAFYLLGSAVTKGRMEKSAIQAGVAEYKLDANFQRQFYWKTNGVK
jgi:hypothetical protein